MSLRVSRGPAEYYTSTQACLDKGYFVLLFDESLRLARGIEGDGYEDIRGALLDTNFGSKVHAGLVITSLAALPISKTISDCEVHAEKFL